MNPRVTLREAQAQLNRLIAVFPRHGMSDDGVVEYADTMAGFFAGEWHMRKVIDEAKRTFRYFPSLAELRDLCDEISAKRPSFAGCPNCIRSTPGMAYVRALWTPGASGESGRFDLLDRDGLESLAHGIDAEKAAALARKEPYAGQDYHDVPIIEIDDNGRPVKAMNPRAQAAGVVGYCTCPAGVQLREMRLAREAEERDRKSARTLSGMRKAEVRA